ncbi:MULTISPECIES: SAVED domain-containing protein [unclassified Mycobacterium]|uniref:SAVED domain-containing protein n=1 Tax=unclassified Mycobacterium TaxID=2642494 RepID=UPI0029C86975|nr:MULTISPECIES: SAVED domain-containing protein [unclassified Mycobacterium]
MALGDVGRRMLWVRAGGRCTLCKKYLLEGDLTPVEVPLGEGAHIVGAVDSPKSPRGEDPLPVDERDSVDNIMLACSNCHNEIDQQLSTRLIDADFLRERKRKHEADIMMQTGLVKDRRTAVLRMAGDIRGDVMELPRHAAAEAVIRSAHRFPLFLESYDRQGIEIDLQRLPGENPLSSDYYRLATGLIDAAIETRVQPGIRNGDITHISLFAIARLPLLIYLGCKLDDGSPVDVYQRHRATDSWTWPQTTDPGTGFVLTHVANASDSAEGLLITNLSGTTPVTDLPTELANLPTWTITPSSGPAEDVFGHPAELDRFADTVRRYFTDLEATHKPLRTLHLIGALPLSGALTLGRILKSTHLRPAVVTYDRTADGYHRALEV